MDLTSAPDRSRTDTRIRLLGAVQAFVLAWLALFLTTLAVSYREGTLAAITAWAVLAGLLVLVRQAARNRRGARMGLAAITLLLLAGNVWVLTQGFVPPLVLLLAAQAALLVVLLLDRD
ncbi:hypothetical protein [Goekera deserti]|uniref:Uncharacterized protein n=1 Tax=Goekera deserti TaxID=2497753 RepID=A0A7K3WJT3_9ACTN|nr:hypothetical protein [Goekera deserti]NDI50235.1 hypothetical protein [Goekera deserti]NEL55803.1 hypothetical protein [Goekera deserti]